MQVRASEGSLSRRTRCSAQQSKGNKRKMETHKPFPVQPKVE